MSERRPARSCRLPRSAPAARPNRPDAASMSTARGSRRYQCRSCSPLQQILAAARRNCPSRDPHSGGCDSMHAQIYGGQCEHTQRNRKERSVHQYPVKRESSCAVDREAQIQHRHQHRILPAAVRRDPYETIEKTSPHLSGNKEIEPPRCSGWLVTTVRCLMQACHPLDGVSLFGRTRPFLRPGLTSPRRRAQPRSRMAEGHRACAARSVLDGCEHGATLGQTGAPAEAQQCATPTCCNWRWA